MMVFALLFSMVVGGVFPADAPARDRLPDDTLTAGQQEVTDPRLRTPWEVNVYYDYEVVSGGRQPWESVQGLVQRRFRQGAVIFRAERTRRFRSWDEAVTGEVYWNLWRQAYGHVQAQYAPEPQTLPETAFLVELFQGLPGGFELSAGYGHRNYPTEPVNLYRGGLAKYLGYWYLRTQTLVVPFLGEMGIAQTFAARRYLGDSPADYAEVRGGFGREVTIVDVGPLIDVARTYFVSARLQKYVSENAGFSVSLSYSDDDFYTRTGVSVGLLTRW